MYNPDDCNRLIYKRKMKTYTIKELKKLEREWADNGWWKGKDTKIEGKKCKEFVPFLDWLGKK